MTMNHTMLSCLKTSLAASGGGLLLLLSGCSSVEPPERPVAYVFPTVRSLDSLNGARERQVGTAQIAGWLARAGVYDDLRAAGMLKDELQLLARGLARNGYAELDLRKTPLDMKWLSLTTRQDGQVDIVIGYARDRGRNMRAGMQRLALIPPDLQRQCQLPGTAIAAAWYGETQNTRRWYVQLVSQTPDQPTLWLKRLILQ